MADQELSQEQMPRKLVVCCDGTWNQRDKAGATTNVAKMARAIRPIDDQGISQLIYYHPGVGTGNWLDRKIGGGLGVGLSGNVQSGYSFLADNFEYGDFLFFFGFSRGAFTARSLAGLVSLVGLLRKSDMEHFPKIYDIYRSKTYRKTLVSGTNEAEIRDAFRALFPKASERESDSLLAAINNARPTNIFFIGVWDTVGSLGAPWPFNWIGGSKFQFHNTDLSENVVYAYHALAIDEQRASFKPTLWTRKPRGKQDRQQVLEQVWFAGCHSNVGGGYEDSGLSDTAFLWMASKAASAALDAGDRPLAFDNDYLATKVARSKGALVNSRSGVWQAMPKHVREIFASPATDKETCERIHASVAERYAWKLEGAFEPFPYRPSNADPFLKQPNATQLAEITEFEKSLRAAT